ncbi:hypothetical protein Hanom_Chr11g00986101 [Helianthus anomalus]
MDCSMMIDVQRTSTIEQPLPFCSYPHLRFIPFDSRNRICLTINNVKSKDGTISLLARVTKTRIHNLM